MPNEPRHPKLPKSFMHHIVQHMPQRPYRCRSPTSWMANIGEHRCSRLWLQLKPSLPRGRSQSDNRCRHLVAESGREARESAAARMQLANCHTPLRIADASGPSSADTPDRGLSLTQPPRLSRGGSKRLIMRESRGGPARGRASPATETNPLELRTPLATPGQRAKTRW